MSVEKRMRPVSLWGRGHPLHLLHRITISAIFFETFTFIFVDIRPPSKRHQLPRMMRGMKKFEKSSKVVTITHGVPDSS